MVDNDILLAGGLVGGALLLSRARGSQMPQLPQGPQIIPTGGGGSIPSIQFPEFNLPDFTLPEISLPDINVDTGNTGANQAQDLIDELNNRIADLRDNTVPIITQEGESPVNLRQAQAELAGLEAVWQSQDTASEGVNRLNEARNRIEQEAQNLRDNAPSVESPFPSFPSITDFTLPGPSGFGVVGPEPISNQVQQALDE